MLRLAAALALLALAAGQNCQSGSFLCPSNDCPTSCNDANFQCFYAHSYSTIPTCDLKGLNPVNGNDIGLFIVLFVVIAFSSAAGIGGGGLLIPLMMVISSIPTYYSVPLSVTSIAGGSIIRFLIQIREHHPVDKRRPLIDVSLVLLLLPPILVGTIIGVIINSVSPTWLVIAIIFLVLSFISYETTKKAIALRKQERKPPSLLPDSVAQPISPQHPEPDHSYAAVEPRALRFRPDHASMSSQRHNESSTDGDVDDTNPADSPSSSYAYHALSVSQDDVEPRKTQESAFPSSSASDAGVDSETNGAHATHDQEGEAEAFPRPRVSTEVRTKAAKAFYSPFLDTITGAQARQLLLDGDMHSSDLTKTQQSSVLEGIRAAEARFPLVPILWTFALLAFVVILSLVRGGQSGETFAGVTCGSGAWASVLVACIAALIAATVWTAVHLQREYVIKCDVAYTFLPGDIKYTLRRACLLPLASFLAGLMAGYLGIGAGMIVGPFLLHLGVLPTVSAATTSYLTLFTSASASIQYITLGRVPVGYGVTLFLLSMAASLAGQYAIVHPIKRRKKVYVLVFILAGIICSAAILLVITGAIRLKQQADDGGHMGFSPLCTN